jgi:hypothetical protein
MPRLEVRERLIVWSASLGLGMALREPLYAQQLGDRELSVREQGAGNDRMMQPSDLPQENLNLEAVTLKTADRCSSREPIGVITAAGERQEATAQNCRSLSLALSNGAAMMSPTCAQMRMERDRPAGDVSVRGRVRGGTNER